MCKICTLQIFQITDMFGVDKSGASKHFFKNMLKFGELNEKAAVAKIATAGIEL